MASTINEYLIALGRTPITLPLAPSALDQIPQIKSMISVNLDSFNLQSAPLTDHRSDVDSVPRRDLAVWEPRRQ